MPVIMPSCVSAHQSPTFANSHISGAQAGNELQNQVSNAKSLALPANRCKNLSAQCTSVGANGFHSAIDSEHRLNALNINEHKSGFNGTLPQLPVKGVTWHETTKHDLAAWPSTFLLPVSRAHTTSPVNDMSLTELACKMTNVPLNQASTSATHFLPTIFHWPCQLILATASQRSAHPQVQIFFTTPLTVKIVKML